MPLIAETCNLLCVLLFPDDLDTVCVALKALHVQEERDRLRLDFNELEERVNPNSTFFLSSMVCGVSEFYFQSACTSIPLESRFPCS